MAKKRLTKSKSLSKSGSCAGAETREEKEKDISAAKSKKHLNSPKREKNRAPKLNECKPLSEKVNVSGTATTSGGKDSIVWRELHFNNDSPTQASLESPFVFKEATKSPRSSVCDMQLNAMFETTTHNKGAFMHATLSSKSMRNDSYVSTMSRRPSRVSSFTSYSSIDNGYEVTYSPMQAFEEAQSPRIVGRDLDLEIEQDQIAFPALSLNERTLLRLKVANLLNFCENGAKKSNETIIGDKPNAARGWDNVPSCCMAYSLQNNNKYPPNEVYEIRELAMKLK